MNRKSYRMLAFVLALAVLFGTFAAMVPATADASGMGGHPAKATYHGGKAYFQPNQLPDPFVRDFGDRCQWWRYELRNGHYVRTFCPCKYGDTEISYKLNPRSMWANGPTVVAD